MDFESPAGQPYGYWAGFILPDYTPGLCHHQSAKVVEHRRPPKSEKNSTVLYQRLSLNRLFIFLSYRDSALQRGDMVGEVLSQILYTHIAFLSTKDSKAESLKILVNIIGVV